MQATKLSATKSLTELEAMRVAIISNPANQRNDGSIHIYTRVAEEKLDVLAWAVTYKLADKRARAA